METASKGGKKKAGVGGAFVEPESPTFEQDYKDQLEEEEGPHPADLATMPLPQQPLKPELIETSVGEVSSGDQD